MTRASRDPEQASEKQPRERFSWSSVGLRPRLLMAFLLVALVPMTVLFLAIFHHTRLHLQNDVRRTLERVADVQQRRLDLELHRLDALLALVASRTQLRISLHAFNRSADSHSLELVDRILCDALVPIPNLDGIWVRNPAGQMVTSVSDRGQREKTPPAFDPAGEPLQVVWPPDGEAQLWLSGPLKLDREFIGSLHILAKSEDLLAVLAHFLILRDDSHIGDGPTARGLQPVHPS